jgi:HPt (histidine-containing phosphotransfer) domain-containing protein
MNSENKLVDLSFLSKFTKGDSSKMKYFIEMYLRTAPPLFGEMEERFDDMNNDEIYARAHSLKPQCAYVGIIGLKELLVEIENATKNDLDKSILRGLVQKAIDLNNRGMVELSSYLKAEEVA